MTDGVTSASGQSRWNLTTCKRDKASDTLLWWPGTCSIIMFILLRAENKNSDRMSFMMLLSLQDPDFQTWTIAMLSVKIIICLFCRRSAQVKTAATTAKSSRKEIWYSEALGHWQENQLEPKTAPKPKLAAASVNKHNDFADTGGSWKGAVPFQVGKNSVHQLISARASELRSMWWFSDETVVERSMRRRKNILPGLITLHAKESVPIKDKSSLFVHF